MAINLLEAVQKNLAYPPLQKIDPNTQEVKVDDTTPTEHRFSQAAIPAVLTGLYTYSASDDNATKILSGETSTGWVKEIFGNTANELVTKVAEYSNKPFDAAEAKMNGIAEEAVKITRQEVKPEGTVKDVKDFLSAQTKNVLGYLPAALQVGQLLNEDTLDDKTNKMEGPISTLMHKIGAAFSNPSTEEEVDPAKKY